MPTISVEKLDESTFDVTVEGTSVTTHRVTVQSSYADKLTGGRIQTDKLVELSFKFLLERESNTSILRRFDLPVIASYFPEYEQAIRKLI